MDFNSKNVDLYRLTNASGMKVDITNFGARIVSLWVPDRSGMLRDVVLGFADVQDYFPENHLSDFGAVVGRYANRIAGGRLEIDGVEYQLPQNNGPNCLHGGPMGWQYAVYDVVSRSENRLELAMVSEDGDNGFPGRIDVRVVYTLSDDNALRVDYSAESDRPTVINMTNHSYFNLNGAECADEVVLNHRLFIDADGYLPVDDTMIPLGGIEPVEGTPMDLRTPLQIGEGLAVPFAQTRQAHGYDHCWALNHPGVLERCAARVDSSLTGIVMEIYTTEPGVQIYTGNFLDGVEGKYGARYFDKAAVCLETQHFPDSPNHNWKQSTGRLDPDKPYRSTTIFSFTVNNEAI